MKTRNGLLNLIVLFFLLCHTINAQEYNILSFGAIADGKTLNSSFIQKAIDAAHKDGGGKVIIPKGKFLSGSIVLKSGVELYLSRGAVLLGSTNPKDYHTLNRWKALIMADQSTNIAIQGKGTIDGQGEELALHIDSLFYEGKVDSVNYEFHEKRPKVTVRPQVIEFVDCKNIKVTDVTIQNGASWVQSYYLCNKLIINNIRVDSDTYWNNDGIDIIDCKNVSILNSTINSSDDGICIKSYGRKIHNSPFCDSILIKNCTVRSSASAIKLGTASFGGFQNIIIENIKVFDTFRSAIALESYGNGFLRNVSVKNVKAKNTGNAIFIKLGKRSKKYIPGIIENIQIKNITVEVPIEIPDKKYKIRGPALPFFHNIFPSSITGIPNHYVKNVSLENIRIIYPGKGLKAYANLPLNRLDDVPENAEKYPEFSIFGELPAWGFYFRHVSGLSIKNLQLIIKKADYRPAMVFDDVNKAKIEMYKVKGDKKSTKYILHNSEEVDIQYP